MLNRLFTCFFLLSYILVSGILSAETIRIVDHDFPDEGVETRIRKVDWTGKIEHVSFTDKYGHVQRQFSCEEPDTIEILPVNKHVYPSTPIRCPIKVNPITLKKNSHTRKLLAEAKKFIDANDYGNAVKAYNEASYRLLIVNDPKSSQTQKLTYETLGVFLGVKNGSQFSNKTQQFEMSPELGKKLIQYQQQHGIKNPGKVDNNTINLISTFTIPQILNLEEKK